MSMESVDITVDGEPVTVEVGDRFTVYRTVVPMGRDAEDLEQGDVITVEDITGQPDGVHFEFSIDRLPDETVELYDYAIEKDLERGGMEFD